MAKLPLTPGLLPGKERRHLLRHRVRQLRRFCLSRYFSFCIAIVCTILLFKAVQPNPGNIVIEQPSSIFQAHHLTLLPRSFAEDPSNFAGKAAAHLPAHSTFPSARILDKFISHAVQYLIRANNPKGDGSFAYRYVLEDGALRSDVAYNTLRHAGAVHALADACLRADSLRLPHCAGANATILRAARWLQSRTVAPLPAWSRYVKRPGEGPVYIGLWSRPSVEHPRTQKWSVRLGEVRLGGIGLGLVALTAAKRVSESSVSAKTLSGIGIFARDIMQKPNGLFHSKFLEETDAAIDGGSVYYPGEAALGLTRLYQITGDGSFLESSVRALEGLNAIREEASLADIPCDHWALIATANLFGIPAFERATKESPEGRARRRVVLAHAKRVLLSCHEQEVARAMDSEVKSSSFGCSLEATMDVLPIFARETEPVRMSKQEISSVLCLAHRTVAALMAAQFDGVGQQEYVTHVLKGAMPGRANLEIVRGSPTVRRVVSDNGVFQIDTTQHALSGVLAYLRAVSHPLLRDIRCHYGGQPWRVVGRHSH